MTEITTWLAEATADRLEHIAQVGFAFADEVEDIALALEVFGIEPSDYERRGDHPLVQLVDALCDLAHATDFARLDYEQQVMLSEVVRALRG